MAILTCSVLLVSGVVATFFSYHESITASARLQDEQALRAASTIESFITDVEQQIAWTMPPGRVASPSRLTERRDDFVRLLRTSPAITEVRYLDGSGAEQLLISRWQTNRIGSQMDRSQDPAYQGANAGGTYFGPVYFRNESEPYMTVAMREIDAADGVTEAEVNLKLIWEVVSRFDIETTAHVYVVDSRGDLIADQEIWPVLRKTNLAGLPHVAAALAAAPSLDPMLPRAEFARNAGGEHVYTSYQRVPATGWLVFVERPAQAVLAPIVSHFLRMLLLLLVGLGTAVVASLLLANRMVRPIQSLTASARKIGAGALDHRIEVRTGNELELLADELNAMATNLQGSHADLERLIQERTEHLEQALSVVRDREANLREERAILLSTMTGMTDGLIVLDPDGCVRYCNRHAAAYFDSSTQQLVGVPIEAMIERFVASDPARRQDAAAIVEALFHVPERPRLEVSLKRSPSGKLRLLEVALFPINTFDSQGTGTGIVLHDVTHVAVLSHLEERERIAMDLHDGIIQSLYAVVLWLGGQERRAHNTLEDNRDALRQAQKEIQGVIHEARKYFVALRMNREPLGIASRHDLAKQIEQLAGHLNSFGISPSVRIASDLDGTLDRNTRQHVLYIVREAFSNILRHANADEVSLDLCQNEQRFSLTVRDNGQGFDTNQAKRRTGHGLAIMAERTAELGGTLDVVSEPGHGTVLELHVPRKEMARSSS